MIVTRKEHSLAKRKAIFWGGLGAVMHVDSDTESSLTIGLDPPINLTIRTEAPIQFADAARGVSATHPSQGQTPPVGNGAHSVPFEASSLAECAPEFSGTTIFDLDRIVDRVLASNRVIDRMNEPCPQRADCAGDGHHARIFDCTQSCGFRGCAACMEEHEAEPHVSDGDTARAASY